MVTKSYIPSNLCDSSDSSDSCDSCDSSNSSDSSDTSDTSDSSGKKKLFFLLKKIFFTKTNFKKIIRKKMH